MLLLSPCCRHGVEAETAVCRRTPSELAVATKFEVGNGLLDSCARLVDPTAPCTLMPRVRVCDFHRRPVERLSGDWGKM